MHKAKNNFMVKRNNQYTCLANEDFKFLDSASYLAPGVNYSKFLKAFDFGKTKDIFVMNGFKASNSCVIRHCHHIRCFTLH